MPRRVAYVRKTLGPESFDTETVHTMDYLEYAYLQTAQDRAAKEVVDELTSFRQSTAPNLPTAYAVAAIPVRYALELPRLAGRRRAERASAIGLPLERFPWAEAMIAYARALGDARTGNIAGAEAEIGRLQSLEDKLKGNNTYWANQVEVQRLAAAQGLDRNRVSPAFDQRVVLESQNFEVYLVNSLEMQVAHASRNEPEKVRPALNRQPFSPSFRKASAIDRDNPSERPNRL